MPRSRVTVAVVVCLGVVAGAEVALAQAIPLGGELQVNTYTTSKQIDAAVGMDSDGDFVVTWSTYNGRDGDAYGIFARRFGAAGVGLGAEFQVNAFTSSFQKYPAVGMDSDGDFVVAWGSFNQDGLGYGVFARRFNSAGGGVGAEFQVNAYSSDTQNYPAVGVDGDGDFVIAWQSLGQDGSGYGVFARRFDAAGSPQAAEFRVNSHTSNGQRRAAVAIDSDGDFVVAWQSFDQDDFNDGIFARRFNSAGSPQAIEFQVNSSTIADQRYPALAMDSDGDFVVAWQSDYGDDSGYGILARRFDSAGSPQASEFQVNSYTIDDQRYPRLAMESGGDFVVVWHSEGQDGYQYGVFARRFDAAGIAIGAEFQVNTHTPYDQGSPAAGMDADGDFVVAWQSFGQDGEEDGIFAQRFSKDVAPTSTTTPTSSPSATPTPTRTNTPTRTPTPTATSTSTRTPTPTATNTSTRTPTPIATNTPTRTPTPTTTPTATPTASRTATPTATRTATPTATRTATQTATPTSTPGVAVLDIDGDGQTEALTDGLLVLRRLFGFTGATLVTGAVDLANCTRCTAPAIEGYLASIQAQLDIDGDGETQPLTDGLLVLRYLFGFTGATLTNGVVDLANCTRCTALAIEAYLQSLT